MSEQPTPTERIIETTADALSDRQWQLRCDQCGRIEPNGWSYFATGWPDCHGYTMRLEAVDE